MNNSVLKLLEEKDKYKSEAKEYKECLKSIYSKIYCIGGPLNDNIEKYTNAQLRIFGRIADEIKYSVDIGE